MRKDFPDSTSIFKLFCLPQRRASKQENHFSDVPAGLVLLQDFNHTIISWKSSTSCRQSRRLLEGMRNNLLSQVIEKPTRGNAILDTKVTNISELMRDVNIGGSLGGSDHMMMEFAVWRNIGQLRSQGWALNFRKADFQLFREIASEILWETALRDMGAEQSWWIFRGVFHRAQELAILRSKKMGDEGKKKHD